MATPPMLPQLPRRLSLVVGGAAGASKHPNIFSYSLGPDSGSSSSSSTRSRSSRRFFSNAEQSTRSRRWWYDEAQFDGDYDEEEQGSSFSGSASWDQKFDEPWFAKVSRAYWYVLPLILASMVLATGPQAFLLAMAVPLAQSAASFAIRAFSSTFGRNQEDYDDDDDYYDYRSSGWEASEEQEYNSTSYSTKYGQGSSSSSRNKQQQPWAKDDMSEVSEPSEEPDDTYVFSASGSNTSRTGFGGWDELDGDDQCIPSSKRRVGAAPPPDAAAADNTATGGAMRSVGRRSPQPESTTRRRRPRSRAAARYSQSPLFMRLLVAVFPFLGSWFRIMF